MLGNIVANVVLRFCCKLVPRLLSNKLTQQTQQSKVFNNEQVLHVNSRGRSSVGRPTKGQETPNCRGSPQVQQYYNRFSIFPSPWNEGQMLLTLSFIFALFLSIKGMGRRDTLGMRLNVCFCFVQNAYKVIR